MTVPLEHFFHALFRKSVADELRLVDRAFAKPVPSPTITLVNVGRALKPVTAQHVQHVVLNAFDGRRKIGDQMFPIRVEANHDGVGEELGDLDVRLLRLEYLVVDSGEIILAETADRFRRLQDGAADLANVEIDERAVALLDFDDSILDRHRSAPSIGRRIAYPRPFTMMAFVTSL